MSVLLHAIAVAGGILLGRWAGRAGREAKALPPGAGEATALTEGRGQGALGTGAEAVIDWSRFPCALGDVVVRAIDSAEAWLAGAIVLSEGTPAAVLFFAPDAAGDRVLLARPRPSEDIAWLEAAPPEALAAGAEPPSAIEIQGVRFERTRRLPLRATRVGSGAPDVGATALLGEYTSPTGEVAVVLVGEGLARAWRGKRLSPDEYEVWPSGKETLGG
jgi:hypothetical protein